MIKFPIQNTANRIPDDLLQILKIIPCNKEKKNFFHPVRPLRGNAIFRRREKTGGVFQREKNTGGKIGDLALIKEDKQL